MARRPSKGAAAAEQPKPGGRRASLKAIGKQVLHAGRLSGPEKKEVAAAASTGTNPMAVVAAVGKMKAAGGRGRRKSMDFMRKYDKYDEKKGGGGGGGTSAKAAHAPEEFDPTAALYKMKLRSSSKSIVPPKN